MKTKILLLFTLLFLFFSVSAYADYEIRNGERVWVGKMIVNPDIDGGTIDGSTINSSTIGLTTPAAGSFTTLIGAMNSSATKTDNYQVLVGDLGKTLIMNSASDKTFTLLSVAAGDIGAHLRFVKTGTGKVTIDAADSDTIGDSGAGDTVYCGGTGIAVINLELVTATGWAIMSVVNEPSESWITTD